VSRRVEKTVRSKRKKSLDEEIEDDKSAREMDREKLNKKKNPPLDALEHHMRRKEIQADEALKMWVKLT
jgi:hypothetical protein